MDFESAQATVEKFELKSSGELKTWLSFSNRPSDFLSTSWRTYARSGWTGIPEFFG